MQTRTRTMPGAEKPLFIPLGYSLHGSETWIHLRVGDQVRTYRPSQALGLSFLQGIYSDLEHWATIYPGDHYHGKRADWRRACSHIHHLCIAAGEYKPDSGNPTQSNITQPKRE